MIKRSSKTLSLHPSHSKSVQLPSDYSTFLATFGAGTFDDGRLSFAIADLSVASDLTAEELFAVLYDRDFRLGSEAFTGFHGIPGIIPWGHDHQETTFYWIADQNDPDRWKVAINGVADNLLVHSKSTTDFLATCLLDRVSFYSELQFDQRTLSFVPSRAG
ncbi:hypothetical protein [Stratiformator vulcanicus]|nr:hypothetical protein [Stratiformator vulcanicus]